MKEAQIKVKLIDFLLDKYNSSEISIAQEVRFEDNSRRADLVCIESMTHAFEIKSKYDSLSNLNNQINDYLKCFESVTVVTTQNHLKNALKICPRSVGIILIDDKNLTVYREALLRKKLTKIALLNILNGVEISAQMKNLHLKLDYNSSVTEVRSTLARKIDLDTSKKIARDFLWKSSEHNFRKFLAERGAITTCDDLSLLNEASWQITP